jgi:D-alanine-D-alanine ligase
MARKLTVLVLFGGRSTEHEVSVRSAASIINALDAKRYDVIPVCISRTGNWLSPMESAKLLPQGVRQLSLVTAHVIGDGESRSLVEITSSENRSRMVDVVFPVLHGTFGEDGTVQGLLELADIPYVGCGVLASAVGMDKHMTKQLLLQAGLATPEFIAVQRVDWKRDREKVLEMVQKKFKMPVFTKPANSGSSVGIRKAHDAQELHVCLDEAFTYDSKAVVEEGIVGRELECSVLGNESPRASIVGEVIPGGEYYDYAEKYLKDTTKLIVPAKLTKAKSDEIREMAVKAFQAIGGEGLARVDFFLEKKSNRVLVNELNTLPGFTSISMYPKMWEATGLGYSELVDELIRLAMERHKDRASNKLSYES